MKNGLEGMKRRSMLKSAGLFAVAATACFAVPFTGQAADKDLTLFEWSGYEDAGFHSAYIEKYGDSPQYAFFGDEEEAFTKLNSGFKADLAHPCSQSVPKWRDAGLLKPIDPARIPAWDDLNPTLRDMPGFRTDDGKSWLIPIDWGNTALTYRTDELSEADVQSLQVFADPKYQGKISIGDNVDDAYALGFLATGVKDWTNVSDEQFMAASDFLRKAHKNVRFYWADNAQISQALASGEVLISWSWNETATTMQADGQKVAMKRDTDEGASTWVCGFALLNGGEGSEDKAYDYINAFIDESSAKYMVEGWGYGHSNAKVLASMDQDMIEGLGLGSVEKFRKNTLWQSPTEPALRQKMISEFEKIKAGF